MNKIFLIGNGFDLAHGLKTKYSDFLLWYINKIVKRYNTSGSNFYDDELITLDPSGYNLEEFDSLTTFHRKSLSIHCKSPFFNRILKQSTDSNWVDIEYEYYLSLLEIYKKISTHNMVRNEGAGKFVVELNRCLDLIKEQLVEYLLTIKNPTYNDQIGIHLKNELRKVKSPNEILFLVFNYTKTIELYINSLGLINTQLIYIHGKLGETGNPIIFGYGDEMDEYYSGIESLNINEFLRNMKSFSYLKTNNYQDLSQFLEADNYSISIMGHSCGISDRVLLNSMFCNQHCKKIRIYYYQKENSENDYFEKTQEISRHFPLDQKHRMRNMIVTFPESYKLA